MFPDILSELGLEPLISRFVLTETERGNAWLFVVMDERISGSIEIYGAEDVLYHITSALQGHSVLFSNSHGLYYAVLLSSSNLRKPSD